VKSGMLVSIECGFRSRDGYLQSDQRVSLEERRTEANNFNTSMVLGRGLAIFSRSAKALELADHYQPQTYCLRSAGFFP
jgi:hypothetical protein